MPRGGGNCCRRLEIHASGSVNGMHGHLHRVEPSSLVATNKKYTAGVYHSLTANFTLLAEFTNTSGGPNGVENDSSDCKIGAYMSF